MYTKIHHLLLAQVYCKVQEALHEVQALLNFVAQQPSTLFDVPRMTERLKAAGSAPSAWDLLKDGENVCRMPTFSLPALIFALPLCTGFMTEALPILARALQSAVQQAANANTQASASVSLVLASLRNTLQLLDVKVSFADSDHSNLASLPALLFEAVEASGTVAAAAADKMSSLSSALKALQERESAASQEVSRLQGTAQVEWAALRHEADRALQVGSLFGSQEASSSCRNVNGRSDGRSVTLMLCRPLRAPEHEPNNRQSSCMTASARSGRQRTSFQGVLDSWNVVRPSMICIHTDSPFTDMWTNMRFDFCRAGHVH